MRTYIRSTPCSRVPHGQYIASSIFVPVMRRAAIARPLPYRQRHGGLQAAALGTHLAARKPSVDLDHGLTVHRRLAFNGTDRVTDARVAQAAGKAVVFNHAAQVEVFDANRIETTDQRPSQFVAHVLARVSNLFMDSRNALLLPLVAVRSFLLACQRLLLAFELLLIAIRVFRVGDSLAIGQRSQAADAEVDADRFAGFGQWCWLNVHDQRNEVAAGRLANNSHGSRIHGNMLRPLHFESAQFGDKQSLVADFKLESRASVFRRLLPILSLKRRVASSFVKEIAERGLQMPQRLLRWHTGYFVQPEEIRVFLEFAQSGAGLAVVHAFAALKRRCSLRKESVVHESCTAESAGKNLFLLGSRVAAEIPALFHFYILTRLFVTNQRRAFLPGLNAGVSSAEDLMSTITKSSEGALRIWWTPQIPMEPFHYPVHSANEAAILLDALAKYDLFQFERGVKPDFSNAGGLEECIDGEWEEWIDEDGEDISEHAGLARED